MKPESLIPSDMDRTALVRLLAAAGLGVGFQLLPIRRGGNNRVHRLVVDGRNYLLKEYFRHPDDARDRLGTEFAFLSFAWGAGLRCVPEPIASDASASLALHEFVEGPRFEGEPSASDVRQALRFFTELNAHRRLPPALRLPAASEACFSLSAHLQGLARRVDRLTRMDGARGVDAEAGAFIRRDLAPLCALAAGSIRGKAEALGVRPDAELAPEDRCLSPSDFGFHNALVEGARLRFIDFEYAGWDDPAKTACDFFSQPAIPVPLSFLDVFLRETAALTRDPARFRARVELLMPVCRLKWCCIMLNEFLPVGDRRRRFARDEACGETGKKTQLEKARGALEGVRAWVKAGSWPDAAPPR